jgi:hypothetical protein
MKTASVRPMLGAAAHVAEGLPGPSAIRILTAAGLLR